LLSPLRPPRGGKPKRLRPSRRPLGAAAFRGSAGAWRALRNGQGSGLGRRSMVAREVGQAPTPCLFLRARTPFNRRPSAPSLAAMCGATVCVRPSTTNPPRSRKAPSGGCCGICGAWPRVGEATPHRDATPNLKRGRSASGADGMTQVTVEFAAGVENTSSGAARTVLARYLDREKPPPRRLIVARDGSVAEETG